MALQKPTKDEFELGFTIPAAGTYLWQFTDGIKKQVKDGPGRSLQIPMQIIEIVKGDVEAILSKHVEFVTLITKEGNLNKKGEETIGMFLDYTGLYNEAAGKFGENVDLLGDAFVAWLNMKLAGKTIKADHDVGKDNNKKERMQFKKFYRSSVSGAAAAKSTQFDD